jgi:hypothetical protein
MSAMQPGERPGSLSPASETELVFRLGFPAPNRRKRGRRNDQPRPCYAFRSIENDGCSQDLVGRSRLVVPRSCVCAFSYNLGVWLAKRPRNH